MQHHHQPWAPDPATRVIAPDRWGKAVSLEAASSFTKVLSIDGVQDGVSVAASFPAASNVLTSSAILRVVWVSGSGTQSVDADIGRGTVLSVAGSNVEVWARNSSGAGNALLVNITAHRGLKPSVPAWKTERAITSDGTNQDFTVPNFAADVQCYRSDSTSQPMTVTVLGPSAVVLSTVFCAANAQCPIIRLPDLAVTVRVNITNGASVGSAVFGLRV